MDSRQNSKKRVLDSPSSTAYLGLNKMSFNSVSTPRVNNNTVAGQRQDGDQHTSTPWSLPSDKIISPSSKAFTKKAALKRSAGLLNLSIGNEDSNDTDFTANGVTKSFNDLNFETDNVADKLSTTERYSPYINRLKRPLTSSSTPVSDSSSPFNIDKSKPLNEISNNNKPSLNHKLRNALSQDNLIRTNNIYRHNDQVKMTVDILDKENLFVPPTKRGSIDNTKSPNDSPSKPMRQKPRLNSSSVVASHIFRSNNDSSRNTSTPIENNKHSFITPSSYKSVKPLQTAFMSSGLLSKKTANVLPQQKAMPETPCKKPLLHLLVETNNGSFANTSNLANSVINATDSSPDIQNTPTSSSKHSNYHKGSSGKYSNLSSDRKSSTRSERAVNTSELQSCLLKFTNEFDDFYEEEKDSRNQNNNNSFSSLSSSIFRDNDKDVEMDIDEEFPATPTKLNNNTMDDETPSRRLQKTKKHFMSSFLGSKPKSINVDDSHQTSPQGRKRKSKLIKSIQAPKTPVEPSFTANSSSGSYNDSSILSTSHNHNTTTVTDMSFSFLQNYSKSSSGTDDDHLLSKFKNVQLIGTGEFSLVYSMEFENVKYAVKRTKHPLTGPKTRLRKLEEVEILKRLQKNEINDFEGHEYVLNFIDCWEFNANLYIMTEFCENGSLDKFLLENGKIAKLDEWRVWKILTEILIGLKFLHNNDILHLDLKPANIFITFEGSLKIGDFGLATRLPIPPYFEREGDREYIAPEVLSHQQYDKPADIFSVGLIMVEIAANIILPDNGVSWQKLRSGDLTDAGKLSSTDLASYTSSLFNNNGNASNPSSYSSYAESVDNMKQNVNYNNNNNLLSSIKEMPTWAPDFITDGEGTLDCLVHWMISPNPQLRPSLDTVLNTYECQFVELRRKCGSVIYEGEFGPIPDNLQLQNEKSIRGNSRILDLSKSRI